ncbi:MAG: hypothetical protein M3552_13960 [Planctomycetota bacterium]|nr:hypothetical protein [Planctomycetaceae bacterium]MDQ3331737.1 hypothetical protein [Planctomycetota bacterium]
MAAPTSSALETDDRFPSGPWKGYFLQRSLGDAKREMELHLSFINGRAMGTGRDGVGSFSLVGRYELDSGKVWLMKKYARHDVFYTGYAERKGIWGTWEIPSVDRDGFRIWPKGAGEGDEQTQRREENPSSVTFDDEPIESDTLSGAAEKETVFSP